ncbi:MAG: hypothetical protein U0797_21590 [Gemmataceae bacterium]
MGAKQFAQAEKAYDDALLKAKPGDAAAIQGSCSALDAASRRSPPATPR